MIEGLPMDEDADGIPLSQIFRILAGVMEGLAIAFEATPVVGTDHTRPPESDLN